MLKSQIDGEIHSLLEKAGRLEGLWPEEASFLLKESGPEEWEEIFCLAQKITRSVFKHRLGFFAPLYFSNHCVNNCRYCGFRRSNHAHPRRVLTPSEFVAEARYLYGEGHRSILMIAGEHPTYSGHVNIAQHLWQLKKEKLSVSLAAELAPMSQKEYRYLYELGIRRCLLFQETYDPETYSKVHEGPKKNFQWRYEAMARAFAAGIEKVGLGILLGLHDFREDIVSMIRHAGELKRECGRFPATLSFPRLRRAAGSDLSGLSIEEVSDEDYRKILALARLALPETEIVLSTRETPAFRDRLLEEGIGVTLLSAGSSTAPGGYTLEAEEGGEQFDLLDPRPLKEVAARARQLGYQPEYSFEEVCR